MAEKSKYFKLPGKHVGDKGLFITRLALGTMNFASRTSPEESYKIMDLAFDQQINLWDTANGYGGPAGVGATEKVIGEWIAQNPGKRDKFVLATKVFAPMGAWPMQGKLSAKHIMASCEDSLRRLQTDYLDILQMHHVDRNAPMEESMQAFEVLTQQGKIRYVGSSNYAGWHIAKWNELAARRNFLGLVSEQCVYNLLNRTVELEVLPACEGYGMGVLPWSPLSGGLLAGILEKTEGGRRASDRTQEELEKVRPQIEQYEALCKDLGLAPAVVALAWLLHQPAVTAPIIGPRTVEQLESAFKAVEVDLDEETLKKLDEIFPTTVKRTGKPGPEAWAW